MFSKILTYDGFMNENNHSLTPQQIEFIESHCEDPSKWKINKKTGLVDLETPFTVKNEPMKKLPVKFGQTIEDFTIMNCGLESLENLPTKAYSLDLEGNNLTSLDGLDIKVTASLYLTRNPINSFIGVENLKTRSLFAYGCNLISIEGAEHIDTFNYDGNPIPPLFLLKIDEIGPKIYYKELMEKYSDKVFGLWDSIDYRIKTKISESNSIPLSELDRLARTKNIIF